jgi:hypothetical protein
VGDASTAIRTPISTVRWLTAGLSHFRVSVGMRPRTRGVSTALIQWPGECRRRATQLPGRTRDFLADRSCKPDLEFWRVGQRQRKYRKRRSSRWTIDPERRFERKFQSVGNGECLWRLGHPQALQSDSHRRHSERCEQRESRDADWKSQFLVLGKIGRSEHVRTASRRRPQCRSGKPSHRITSEIYLLGSPVAGPAELSVVWNLALF